MNGLKFFAAALCALLLSACASGPPPVQSPQPRAAGLVPHVLSRSALVEQTSHVTGHLDEDHRIVYFQNEGGGGAGLGLLLGPLGVMANISLIESRTKADIAGIQGKVGVDVKSTFLKAAGAAGFPLANAPNAGGPRITPYLNVSKLEGDTLMVSAVMLVEQGEGAQGWVGRYVFELPGRYSLAAFASPDPERASRLAAAAEDAYVRLLRYFGSESSQQQARERPVAFTITRPPYSGYERHGMLVSEEPDVTWIRVQEGVLVLRRETVKVAARAS